MATGVPRRCAHGANAVAEGRAGAAGLGEQRRDLVERVERARIEPHDGVVVRRDELGDVPLAEALGRLAQRAQRLTQRAAHAIAREVVARAARIGDEPAQVLALAHDLEPEALGGRRRRIRRRLRRTVGPPSW